MGGLDQGISLHSATTGYLAAFFGGPLSGILIALLNSRKLGRLKRDWPLLVIALGAEVTYGYWLVSGGPEHLEDIVGDFPTALPRRLLGAAAFGLVYLMHRTYYRNSNLVGLKTLNGWGVGLVAIGLGLLVHAGVVAWATN